MDNVEENPIYLRIQQRLLELGLTPRAASKKAGGSPDLVRNMMRAISVGKRYSPRADTLTDLARALETTPEWLLTGHSDREVEDTAQMFKAMETAADILPVYDRLIPAVYGGKVEAGAFRPVDDYGQELHEPVLVSPDRNFTHATMVVFDVVGDSMNNLLPRPILPGDRIVCVDLRSIGGVPIRSGMVVVVQRSVNGGHLLERSVKQVEFYEDRTEFRPRSKNPKHQPIVVPRDRTADDGQEVQVIALVRAIQNELPFFSGS